MLAWARRVSACCSAARRWRRPRAKSARRRLAAALYHPRQAAAWAPMARAGRRRVAARRMRRASTDRRRQLAPHATTERYMMLPVTSSATAGPTGPPHPCRLGRAWQRTCRAARRLSRPQPGGEVGLHGAAREERAGGDERGAAALDEERRPAGADGGRVERLCREGEMRASSDGRFGGERASASPPRVARQLPSRAAGRAARFHEVRHRVVAGSSERSGRPR